MRQLIGVGTPRGLQGRLAAVLVALQAFANVSLPARVLTFTWPQLYAVAGFASVLIPLGLLIASDADTKAGLFLSLIGAIGLLCSYPRTFWMSGRTWVLYSSRGMYTKQDM